MATERLSDVEIQRRLHGVPGWERVGQALAKHCTFTDFRAAMAFVNQVADLAEAADHHPDILLRYTQVTLTLATHSAGGITEKDLRLAQQIDQLS